MATLKDHKNKEIIILAENQEESDDAADGCDAMIGNKQQAVKGGQKRQNAGVIELQQCKKMT